MLSVVGRGCVILECREDVRLGMTRFSAWSRVGGRSPVRGRRLSEGAMLLMRSSDLAPDGWSRLYITGEEKQFLRARCNRPWSPRNGKRRVSLEGFAWSGEE